MKKLFILIGLLFYTTIGFSFTYWNSTSNRIYVPVLGSYIAAHDTFDSNYRIMITGITFIDYKGGKESIKYSNVIYFPRIIGDDTLWMDTISVPYDTIEVIELMPSDTILIYPNDTSHIPIITTNAVTVTQKNTIARLIFDAFKHKEMAIEVHMINKSYLR